MCHVTIFVALNYDSHKSTVAISFVVNFPYWVCHVVMVESLSLSFDVRLFINIFELLIFFNRILKFLNFEFHLRVFIQPCSIGK